MSSKAKSPFLRRRKHGFTQSEFREWTEEYHRAGVDALKVNKKGLEAEYRAEVKRLQAKIGELVMENEIRKGGDASFHFSQADVTRRSARRRWPKAVICRILDVARSSAYYREHDRVPIVDEIMAQRIKHLIDAESYLGYRMAWARLRRQGFKINRKAVQRIMQLKGSQCHRRLKKRCSPRVESSPSVALVSDVRWATDATYVWTRLDVLVYVNAVLDCADRQCIGFNVSQRNDAREAAWALEDALIRRFGALPKGDADIMLRTDNALVHASELYPELAKSYGLHQEFILPHTPEQNGVAESFMGTLKLECLWQHRFKTYEEAKATITAWVKHYNETRPHSRLDYLPPVEWRRRQAEISA